MREDYSRNAYGQRYSNAVNTLGVSLPDVRAASIDSLDRVSGMLSDPERSPGLREAAGSGGVNSAGGGSYYHQLKEGPPLYRAASQILLQHIKNVVELLPRPPQV